MDYWNLFAVPSPCFVVDAVALQKNLDLLAQVQKRSGARILLALKAFSLFALAGMVREALCGTSASSVDEARLGFEEYGGEVHVVCPAYKDQDFDAILRFADHVIFNSFSQWERFRGRLLAAKKVRAGIRVNPEHREVDVELYDPCAPLSRLGVTRKNFRPDLLNGVSGLHFHTLCEKDAQALGRTLAAFEDKFGGFLHQVSWVNFGGGHHITRPGYDVDFLCGLIADFKKRWPLEVYLEPGEAVALNSGILVAEVQDVVQNKMNIAILDASATAHTPDVLEMPYRPQIIGAANPGELAHTFRLAGVSCLAGDIFGDYSFEKPLKIGDRLAFTDMAHYSMVKNNTFNGVRLPSIAVRNPDGSCRVIRRFGYEDFKGRLS